MPRSCKPTSKWMMALIVPATMLTAGCQTLSTPTPEAVCKAIGSPIRYTSKVKESDYYAAPKLAPQLAVKNRTGIHLNCPAYVR
jgi:hypothetical protein